MSRVQKIGAGSVLLACLLLPGVSHAQGPQIYIQPDITLSQQIIAQIEAMLARLYGTSTTTSATSTPTTSTNVPALSVISPSASAIGSKVQIKGSNFTSATSLHFDGHTFLQNGGDLSTPSSSGTEMTFTVPSQLNSCALDEVSPPAQSGTIYGTDCAGTLSNLKPGTYPIFLTQGEYTDTDSRSTSVNFTVTATTTSTSTPTTATTTVTSTSTYSESAAIDFVASMYDPSVQLVREFPGATTHWLWSDNFLAQIVLRSSYPTLATTINQKINSYGVPMHYDMFILDPSYAKDVSFGAGSEITVPGTTDIRYVTYDPVGTQLSCTQYADTAFLKTIYYYKQGDMSDALRCYNDGKATWNGIGMKDSSFDGTYAVYKTALGLAAQEITGFPAIGIPADYFDKFQAANGGIRTDIVNGNPSGDENVETTSLVIIAKDISLLNVPLPAATATASSTSSKTQQASVYSAIEGTIGTIEQDLKEYLGI